jgi:hypothetical protein
MFKLTVKIWWSRAVSNAAQAPAPMAPASMALALMAHTVKGARGKVWFDSLNIKYASKLSCYASPEAYLSHLTSKMTNALFNFLSDKYA